MRRKILITIAILLIPTCFYTLKSTETNTYYLGPRIAASADRPTVYVEGRDLQNEYRVIEASGLFEFSDDPATPIHLTLHKDRPDELCGLPLLSMIFSFGLVPLKVPRRGELDLSLTEGGVTTKRTYTYDCERRTSFWESFRESDEIEELGQSVRAGAR